MILPIQKVTPAEAYRRGVSCGLVGPMPYNCDFAIFSTKENAAEWERGKRDGEAAKVSDKRDGGNDE